LALSSDGNTLAIGGPGDSVNIGATWIFTRSGNTWTQQGSKLVGTSYTGSPYQGASVALSADGNQLVIGGPLCQFVCNGNSITRGATWGFTRSSNVWTQQFLTRVTAPVCGISPGTGCYNTARSIHQGSAVAISGNSNTIFTGAPYTYQGTTAYVGAVWILK
jgi:hypothetical protein